jgi:hypothetical protein
MDAKSVVERLEVASDELVQTVKDLIREGNVRRITVKNAEGRVLMDLPLTAGIVGVLLLPVWATLGAIAALAGGFKIEVERTPPPEKPAAGPEQPGQKA